MTMLHFATLKVRIKVQVQTLHHVNCKPNHSTSHFFGLQLTHHKLSAQCRLPNIRRTLLQ